ncbi:MAG: hypothetical protein IJG63_04115, partial [Oscillospiraceae bacterium]|nr:hypothetical protein [Oscillospiraceae bacterium]
MTRFKKILIFIILAAVLALAVFLIFNGLVRDCLDSLSGNIESVEYYGVCSGNDGYVYALGERRGHDIITCGTENGARKYILDLDKCGLPQDFELSSVYVNRVGGIYLSLYASPLDEYGVAQRTLFVYYISPDKSVIELISQPCTGVPVGGHSEPVWVSAFASYEAYVSFIVCQNNICQAYNHYYATAGEIEMARAFECDDSLKNALVLSDGSAAMCYTGGRIAFSNDDLEVIAEECVIDQVFQGENGLYFMDGATRSIMYVNEFSRTASLSFLLDSFNFGSMLSLSTGVDGDTLVLTDSTDILRWKNGEVTDISDCLCRGTAASVLILAAFCVLVLVIAYALWYVLCEFKKMQISMVARIGGIFAVLLFFALAGVLRGIVLPYCNEQAGNIARSTASVAAQLLP